MPPQPPPSDWSRRRSRPVRPPHFGHDDRRLETRMLSLDTADGHSWDAMLFRPRERTGVRRVAVVVVHGSVGNYLSGVPRRAAFGLAQAGFSALTINTRMANYGAFFGTGLLDRVPLDLDAAIALLRRLGYRRIVLLGYSMGSTVVTHYQAVHEPPEVIGVCTIAHPLSLPGSLRARWERYGSRPSYQEMAMRVSRGLGEMDDPDKDRIVVVHRANGPSSSPEHAEIWTYRTWWHSRGPAALSADSRRWVGVLRVPLAIIQAGRDQLIPRGEGEMLQKLAVEGGCPSVHLEYVEDADHVFSQAPDAPIAAAEAWLRSLLASVPGGAGATEPHMGD